MNQGHLRSILPQRGGVSPVDNNTVALFHYDEHAKDSIRGVALIGHAKALEFKSTSDKVTLAPLLPNDEFSVTCWIYAYGLSATEYSIAAQYVSGDAGRALFTINQSTGAKLRAFIGGQSFFGATALQTGRWYHVAMVKKTDGTGVLYLDGVQDGAGTLSNTPIPSVNFEIGHGAGRFFDGLIYDFHLYSKALSDIEVEEVMKGQGGKANALIGKWDLSEGGGSIARDLSSSGNDGIISGGIWTEGRSVHSLAKDAPTKGGVLVEEATTNLMGPRVDLQKTSESGPYFLNSISHNNLTSKSGYPDAFGGNSAVLWDNTDGGNIRFGSTSIGGNGIDYGKTYTMSIYAKVEPGGVMPTTFSMDVVDRGTTHFASNITSEWQRFSITALHDNSSSLHFADFHLVGKLLVCFPQIEQKGYATSFVDGSRGVGFLQHRLAPLSAPLTCSFWFKRTAGSFTSQLVNLIDGTGEWRLWLDWSNDMSFSLAHITSTGTTSYGRVDGGITSNSWTFIAFVISETELILYQDGEVIGRSTHGATPPKFELLTVGCHVDSAQPPINGVFDELRIDKVARTETEIQAWYYQGRNGW